MQFLLIPGLIVSTGLLFVASESINVNQNGNRLIKTSANEPALWLDQNEIFALIAQGQNFIDITDNPSLEKFVPGKVNTKGT